MEIINTTISKYKETFDDSYEVWCEETDRWISFDHSCYQDNDEFPVAKDAAYPINLITVYDTTLSKYFTWAMPHSKQQLENSLSDKHDLTLFKFNNEIDLLKSFIDWLGDNRPDIIAGWNIKFFDIPYIIRRVENILGDDYAKRLSPVDDYYITEDRNNPNEISVSIKGVSQMDQLILYRDKFQHKVEGGGYKLDNVCEFELGENKLKYKGTMKEFYQTNFQQFFEYNVRDVELLVRLEEKLRMVDLARSITSAGLCQPEAIYTSIGYIIGSLNVYAKNNKSGVFPTYKDRNSDMSSEKFEGAYVFPTKMGFYQDGVIGIDLASLYPKTIIATNISPDTKVGQLHEIDSQTYDLYRPNGTVKRITDKQLNKLLEVKCSRTKNNTLMYKSTEKLGIIPAWLIGTYNKRADTKKEMRVLNTLLNKIDKLVDIKTKDVVNVSIDVPYNTLKGRANEIVKSGIFDTELINLYFQLDVMYSRFGTLEQSLKLFMNSLYGVLGTPFSPLYDPDLAQSTTLTGQFINKSTSQFVKDRFGQECVIAGDTDSLYITLEEFIVSYYKKFNKQKLQEFTRSEINIVLKEIDTFVNEDVNNFAATLVNTECHTIDGHNIKYERELLASEAIFFKKKHYLMHLIDIEGNKVDKFKYMGIAVKKGELPLSIKTFLKDIYENTCKNGWGYDDYRKYLTEVYDKFMNFDYDDISVWKGYRTPKESTGFLQTEKGTGAQVRGLHYHNQLLDDMKIKDRYTELRLGDMIRYCYINNTNEYGIDVISFMDDAFPGEFRELFTIDYIKMFNKLVIKPLEGYVAAMGFVEYKPTNQMVDDVFDL